MHKSREYTVNSLVLAGNQSDNFLNDVENKALYSINKKMMVEYIIDALNNTEGVDRIVVLGPKSHLEELLKGRVEAVIEANGTLVENLVKGIKYLGYEKDLLICASDIPLITAEAINDFLQKAVSMRADFCYPIINRELNNKRFPGMKKTYVKTRDGVFTGGNILYVNPSIIESRQKIIEKLIAARKSPLKMARLLSLSFMLRTLTGTMTISKAEKEFSNMLNIKARVVISDYPEIGNDVDKPNDMVTVAAYLQGQPRTS